jgi:hypothetical protein
MDVEWIMKVIGQWKERSCMCVPTATNLTSGVQRRGKQKQRVKQRGKGLGDKVQNRVSKWQVGSCVL